MPRWLDDRTSTPQAAVGRGGQAVEGYARAAPEAPLRRPPARNHQQWRVLAADPGHAPRRQPLRVWQAPLHAL